MATFNSNLLFLSFFSFVQFNVTLPSRVYCPSFLFTLPRHLDPLQRVTSSRRDHGRSVTSRGSVQSTDTAATRRRNERVRSSRVTRRISGRSSRRESGGRVDKVGTARRGKRVGPSVSGGGGRVDGLCLGSTGLEQRSDEGVVDFLGVLLAGVEEPDEEGELEGEVLGNVVEDDSEGGGFQEVEETDCERAREIGLETIDSG
jgi:hypothetical protein